MINQRADILANAAVTICKHVGMCRTKCAGTTAEVIGLAERVGLTADDMLRDPVAVAAEITLYLDDLVRNP